MNFGERKTEPACEHYLQQMFDEVFMCFLFFVLKYQYYNSYSLILIFN